MSRLQEPQAEALQMGVKRLAFRGTVGSLTPTSQVTHRAEQHKTIQFPKAFPGIAGVEVSTPAFTPAVDVVDHLSDGNETPSGPVSSRIRSRARVIALVEGNTLR